MTALWFIIFILGHCLSKNNKISRLTPVQSGMESFLEVFCVTVGGSAKLYKGFCCWQVYYHNLQLTWWYRTNSLKLQQTLRTVVFLLNLVLVAQDQSLINFTTWQLKLLLSPVLAEFWCCTESPATETKILALLYSTKETFLAPVHLATLKQLSWHWAFSALISAARGLSETMHRSNKPCKCCSHKSPFQ